MTSLATCIRKMGKALNSEDADAIRAIMAEGGTAENAVSEYLTALDSERSDLIAEIEAAGGRIELNLTMAEIDLNTKLNERDAGVQQRFAQWATTTPWYEVRSLYNAIDGTAGPENTHGGKVMAVDAARELSPEFVADRTLAVAVHEISSSIVKKLYAERLGTGNDGDRFVWLSGGTGAGKTTGMEVSGGVGAAALWYDGNLSSLDSAVGKIDDALDAGKLVGIIYTWRDPADAFKNGVLSRAEEQKRLWKTGRTMSVSIHVSTHIGARKVIFQLRDHYANDPRVVIEAIDNSNGWGNAKPMQLNQVPDINGAEVVEQAYVILEEAHDNGTISDETYESVLKKGAGAAPAKDTARGPAGGEQSQQLYSRTSKKLAETSADWNPEGRPRSPKGTPRQPIPSYLSQADKYAVALKLAIENRNLIEPILERISTRLGLQTALGIKTKEKAIDKANRHSVLVDKNRPWHNLEHITDIFRFRVLVTDMAQAAPAMQTLQDDLQRTGGLNIIRSDIGNYETGIAWGWKPVNFDVQMPNGQIVEFQISPDKMAAYARKEGHGLYERWRSRDTSLLVLRELRRLGKNFSTSEGGYSGAYQEYLVAGGITARADVASVNKLEALVESFTVRNSSSISDSTKNGVGSGAQTPSVLSARHSGSSMTAADRDFVSSIIKPLYSRDGGTQPALKQAELQLALAPAIRALVGTVAVHIVQTTAEIPGDVVPTDVEGVFRPKTGEREFWLVADNLPSAERAKKVFAHEGFGHLAMERISEFQEVLASVKNLLAIGNKQFLDVAEKVAITQGNLNETNQAKEILAYMAENGIENGTIARAYAAVRAKLRSMGLLQGVNYSESEIKALLVRAARDLVSDASAKQLALSAMPLQEQILSDPNAVADAVHLAVKEVFASATMMDASLALYGEMETASPERRTEIQKAMYLQRIAPGAAPDVMDPEALYARAYHGTGASFPEFDINYLGTGEGFQAFGWGLYFSSLRAVAEWYQRKMTPDMVTFRGQTTERKEAENEIASAVMKVMMKAEKTPQIRDIKAQMLGAIDMPELSKSIARFATGMISRKMGKNLMLADVANQIKSNIDLASAYEHADIGKSRSKSYRAQRAYKYLSNVAGMKALQEMIEADEISVDKGSGSLMEVEIPDNDDLLHYEDMINEHAPEVVAKIKAVFPELFRNRLIDSYTGDLLDTDDQENLAVLSNDWEKMGFIEGIPADYMTGEAFYKYIGDQLINQNRDSEFVLDRSRNEWLVKMGGPQKWLGKVLPGFASATKGRSPNQKDRVASEYLRDKLGIPGHSYLGATSNAVDYVIYDDSTIQMIAINDVKVKVAADLIESETGNLYSRLPSYIEHRAMLDIMRLQDRVKGGTTPAAAAEAQLRTEAAGQPAGWMWKIANEAGTRAFARPKGSWEQRYYTELGRLASKAAGRPLPQGAIGEQMALFSRSEIKVKLNYKTLSVLKNPSAQELGRFAANVGESSNYARFDDGLRWMQDSYHNYYFWDAGESTHMPVYTALAEMPGDMDFSKAAIRNPGYGRDFDQVYPGEDVITKQQVRIGELRGFEPPEQQFAGMSLKEVAAAKRPPPQSPGGEQMALFSRSLLKVPESAWGPFREVTVLKNPSIQELSRFVADVSVPSEGMRWMQDDDSNWYFFDADESTHRPVIGGLHRMGMSFVDSAILNPGKAPDDVHGQRYPGERFISKRDVRQGNLEGFEPPEQQFAGMSLKEVAAAKRPPPQSPGGEQMALFSRAPAVDTPEFKAWFGASKVVDEDGEPKVVYHGTTHDFDTFSTQRSNIASQFGMAFYFTDDKVDVSVNYAGEGPDLTSRIEQQAETIESEAEDRWQDELSAIAGKEFDVMDGDDIHDAAVTLAEKTLSGGAGNVMPVYLKMENPADMINGKFEYEVDWAYYENEAKADVPEDADDFDFQVGESARELFYEDDFPKVSGSGVALLEAFETESPNFYDIEGVEIRAAIEENFGYGEDMDGVSLQAIMDFAKEAAAEATDFDGNYAVGEYLRGVLETAGYDGVILDAARAFGPLSGRGMTGSMAMGMWTKHYIAFKPNQVKSSIGNRGTFDAESPNILYSRNEIRVVPKSLDGKSFADPVTVLKDPTARELRVMMGYITSPDNPNHYEDASRADTWNDGEDDGLRWFKDSKGSHYFWDAFESIHRPIINGLGLEEDSVSLMYSSEDIITEEQLKSGNLRGYEPPDAMPTRTRQPPLVSRFDAMFSRAAPVESPEFKAWFGDSKVVNAGGSPQLVYHGTQETKPFTVFEPQGSWGGWNHVGTWFSSEQVHAERMAEAPNWSGEETTSGRIVEAYVSIKDPFEASWEEVTAVMHDVLEKAGTDQYTQGSGVIFRNHLQNLGYDGIIIRNFDGDNAPTQDMFVALESNQIKSPENQGAFDAENPDIMFSRVAANNNFPSIDVEEKLQVLAQEIKIDANLGSLDVSINDAGALYVEFIEVSTDRRGQGVGSRAMQRLISFADEQGLPIELEVSYEEGRPKSELIRFYEKLGFLQRPQNEYTAAGDLRRDVGATKTPLYSRFIHPDPEIEAIRARRLSPALEDRTIKDRLRDVVNRVRGIEWLNIKQGLIDSAASVEALEKGTFGKLLDASTSAYKAMLATRNLGSVMAAIMHRGIPMYQNGVFMPRAGRQGLIDIFLPITNHKDGNLLPLWELYAAVKRAQRLILEENPDGTSKEKNFTQAEIDKALTLGAEYPEFEVAFLNWQKFNSQLLDLAIKTGVINGAEAKIWRQNDYVPFYRAMEEIEYEGGQGPQTGGGGGVANVRAGIKRLTGSENRIGNVFENMVMNTSYLIDAIYRNTAMQRIVAMADGIAMEKIPMAWEAVRFSDGDIARALMRAGLIVGQGTTEADMFNDGIRQVKAMSAEQKEHWSTLFRRVAPKGDNIVSVLIQGKPVYYEVSDPLLFRSIASMGARQFGGIMHTFRFARRLLTKAVTIDPAFMLANFIRDTLSTAVVTKGSGVKQITEAIKGLKAAWAEDPVMLDIMMAGAGGGGYYDHNPADVRKMLAKKMPAGEVGSFVNSVLTPRGLWRFWQKVGNASEQANRVAVHRRVIEAGGTPAEAAYQARDVLNFTMSGDFEAMKAIVQSVPFLNARIQGLYRLARGGKENPVGFAMKGLVITMATLALLAKNRDDDRYKELPEWDKDTYWHFFIGDEHFRLPKPFEVGAIFGTIPERMVMLSTGDDTLDVAAERAVRMMLDTFAFNPIPQAIKPIWEQYSNRNMFTGNPIIGMHHQGLEPEAQYDPWTSETMRELAKILPGWGGSPKRLESFMRGYLGAIGMYALSASDSVTRRAFGHPDRPTKGIRNYPAITRFWRDPHPRTSKYSSQLYDMMGEADSLYKTMNAYRDQRRIGEAAAMMKEGRGKLQARKFLHDVASSVRKVNARIRLVQYGNMSPDAKKSAIDKLNDTKLRLLRKVARVSDIF